MCIGFWISINTKYWHFCSQWFRLHQVRPKVQIKCRTLGRGVGMHENPPSTIGAQSLGPGPAIAWQAASLLGFRTMCFLPRGVGPALRASQSLPWRGHPCGWCGFIEDHRLHPNESPCCLVPPRAGHWLHLSGCFGMWETCSRGLCGPLESQLHQYVEQILWLSFSLKWFP